MHSYTVYILRCGDGSLYTGMTSDLPLRLFQHETAVFADCYTVMRRPVSLVYTAIFSDVSEAISWERRLKRWSRRKKEALITGEWDELEPLSRNGIERIIRTVQFYVNSVMVSVMLSTVEARTMTDSAPSLDTSPGSVRSG